MSGIYIHIPFCKRICGYCDFYKCTTVSLLGRYTTALCGELDARNSVLTDRTVRTIYFGGGTPSLLPPSFFKEFIERTSQCFDCSALSEVTVEANPDDLSEEYLARLSDTPVNRLSIGIQSFDDDELRFMNRRHTAQQAVEAVRNAQNAGFHNISIDLMYGLPCSDNARWQRTLDTALTLEVQHISAYHLTFEQRTRFGAMLRRGTLSQVDESVSEQQYDITHRTLTEAGFDHYEISNFALPGYRALHNSAYWNNVQYLGLGAAAHSFDGTHRVWCASDVKRYVEGCDDLYTSETLTDDQRYDEYVMTRLRTAEGIDIHDLEQRFGAYKLQYFRNMAERFTAGGELLDDGSTVRIPPQHFLISDSIICELFADEK